MKDKLKETSIKGYKGLGSMEVASLAWNIVMIKVNRFCTCRIFYPYLLNNILVVLYKGKEIIGKIFENIYFSRTVICCGSNYVLN